MEFTKDDILIGSERVRPPDFTLTAGPTMASPRVLAALGSPIIFDYDPVFLERFKETEACSPSCIGPRTTSY